MLMSRMLKNEKIYPQQDELAAQVIRNIRKRLREEVIIAKSDIVCLQPQQGKTGVIAAIVEQFIEDCKRDGKTFQVIVISGQPHLDLRDQTKNRLTTFGSPDGKSDIGAELDVLARASGLVRLPGDMKQLGILVFNNTLKIKKSLAQALKKCKVDRRLIIIDEVHIGNGCDGNIDVFYKTLGIRIQEQIHTWDKSVVNIVVGVSATPFAHAVLSGLNPGNHDTQVLFNMVYLKPTRDYNGISDMLLNGRLRQSERIISKKGEITLFFETVLGRFKTDCQVKGPGYLVLRVLGDTNVDKVKSYVDNRGFRQREFSTKGEDLLELNDYISSPAETPTVVIIRGAMRAGMTLGTGQYIRAWVEGPKSVGTDTQVQAGIGRACGYGRLNDDYPIYCDLKAAEEYHKYFKALEKGDAVIPNGIQNHATHARGKAKGRRATMTRILTLEEAKKEQIRRRQFRTPGKRDNSQFAHTASNQIRNIALFALNEAQNNGNSLGYYFNGPHPNFREDYERALAKYGRHLDGKVLMIDQIPVEAPNGYTLQKRTSALAPRKERGS